MWPSMQACQPPIMPSPSQSKYLSRSTTRSQSRRMHKRMSNITIGDIVRGDREIFPPYLYEAYQSTRRRAPTLPLIDVPMTITELTGPGHVISAITPED